VSDESDDSLIAGIADSDRVRAERSTEALHARYEGASSSRSAAEMATAPSELGRPIDVRAHPVVTYAVVEHAERYRKLMQVLLAEHRNFGLRLRPEEVAERAREQFGLVLDNDKTVEALDALGGWGALDREHDASLAVTPEEYRRNRFTYEVTAAGRRTEEFLSELDRLQEHTGALDGSRLPGIRDALDKLADLLACDEPDALAVRARFERVLLEVEQLHAGAVDFMRSLTAVVSRGEALDELQFEQCKRSLIDHLQGFRRDFERHAEDILQAFERVEAQGSERMVGVIVELEDLPELPGVARATAVERRREELLGQWAGVRKWFRGDRRAQSPWQSLKDRVVMAIRSIIDIAEAIAERRSGRIDRARAYEHLAALASRQQPGQAPGVIVAAFGIGMPRHVGVVEHDPEAISAPGSTSWWAAPPAPVVAYLRRPGSRRPGGGSGAPIPDLAPARERAAQRREHERAELVALLRRFPSGAPVHLSDVARLDDGEFRHLLGWLARAFETARDRHGARHAQSSDGRVLIRLEPPAADAARVSLVTPTGVFHSPDYRLQVSG